MLKANVGKAVRTIPQTVKNILEESRTNQSVDLYGWVMFSRKQKQQTFLQISDGSCFKTLQSVIPSEMKSLE
jgi:asparaginyl-tRNA synthetase